MLKHRLITAGVLLPLVLIPIIWGPAYSVAAIIVICVGLSSFETAKMLTPRLRFLFEESAQDIIDRTDTPIAETWLPVVVSLLVINTAIWLPLAILPTVILLAFTVLLVSGILIQKSVPGAMAVIVGSTFSLIYGCLPWMAIWKLYLLGANGRYILLLCAIVMLSDTGAYFCGRSFGKHKLAPRLSPKKTWEGAFGGICCAVIGALFINWIFGHSLGPHWLMVLAALMAGTAGILGDLVESAFKRFAGVKDSGAIFPGHGGFLDRSDAVVLAAPLLLAVVGSYRMFAL